jgi:hypothetical protein
MEKDDILYLPSAFKEGKLDIEFVEKASLPRLVEKMTPPHSYSHEEHVKTVLLTLTTFTQPQTFLELLYER